MKITKNILTMAFSVLVFSGLAVAQENTAGADTAKVRLQQREQQQEQVRSGGQTAEQNGNHAQDQAGKQSQADKNRPAGAQAQGSNTAGVKKIQGARPDWSKARGARPASVERPSGSRIPNGAGKPGGARGPGKR